MLEKTLYLGLNLPEVPPPHTDHFPIIEITPYTRSAIEKQLQNVLKSTHMIVTSRTTARLLDTYFTEKEKAYAYQLPTFVIGKASQRAMKKLGYQALYCAPQAQGEGIVSMLPSIAQESVVFYPHSEKARPLIKQALEESRRIVHAFSLYTVKPTTRPLPALSKYRWFYFTSSSTVEAFFTLYGTLPPKEQCLAIGPLTQQALNEGRLALT